MSEYGNYLASLVDNLTTKIIGGRFSAKFKVRKKYYCSVGEGKTDWEVTITDERWIDYYFLVKVTGIEGLIIAMQRLMNLACDVENITRALSNANFYPDWGGKDYYNGHPELVFVARAPYGTLYTINTIRNFTPLGEWWVGGPRGSDKGRIAAIVAENRGKCIISS